MSFRSLFFRHYDNTVGIGTCTFFETGISKNDFTKLCTDPDFVLDDLTIRRAAVAMKLSEEEKNLLLEAAREARESSDTRENNI